MAEKIPGWLERVLLPQISELKGDIKAMDAKMEGEFKVVHSEIKRLDQKIDGVDLKLTERIDNLDEKLTQRIDGVDKRMDDLGERMDVTQRLATVEAKVQELESRR